MDASRKIQRLHVPGGAVLETTPLFCEQLVGTSSKAYASSFDAVYGSVSEPSQTVYSEGIDWSRGSHFIHAWVADIPDARVSGGGGPKTSRVSGSMVIGSCTTFTPARTGGTLDAVTGAVTAADAEVGDAEVGDIVRLNVDADADFAFLVDAVAAADCVVLAPAVV